MIAILSNTVCIYVLNILSGSTSTYPKRLLSLDLNENYNLVSYANRELLIELFIILRR